MDAYERGERLCKNLRLMYRGELVALVSGGAAILSLLYIVWSMDFYGGFLLRMSLIAFIVGGVMNFVGLVGLRNVHADYMTALTIALTGIVLVFCYEILGGQIWPLDLAGTVLAAVATTLTIQATNACLEEREESGELPRRGRRLMRGFWITYGIDALTTCLVVAPFPETGILVIDGVNAVVNLIVVIFYMGYLRRGSMVFR